MNNRELAPPEAEHFEEEGLSYWVALILMLILAGIVVLILAFFKPKVENVFSNSMCYAVAPPPPVTPVPSPEARSELLSRLVAEGRLPSILE